ncbi:hypothetical protein [Streptomyces sp. NPDC058579]|uniref:hypothetical protein n=1 Tax=Streptomyces sp. NPDC058579 TaxID=3346548 RepID=UPI003658B288
MSVRPAALGLAAALLVSLFVTGCSGGDPVEPTGERAYYNCLEENGVVLEKRDDGVPRVDKDQNAAAQAGAEAKCANLLAAATPTAAASPPPAAFLKAARQFSSCVRQNGFPAYPDPDPATGEVALTPEERAAFTTPEFRSVVTKCAPDTGSGVVGG